MLCPNCQASLKGEKLYCHECGYKVAVHEQQEKVDQAQANIKKSILSTFKNPLTVILAITMTFMATLGFFDPIGFVFSIISAVGLWKCVASKEKDDFFKVINMASMYDGYMKIYYLISMVAFIIIDVFSICVTFFEGMPLVALIQVISCVLGALLMNAFVKFFERRRAYMMEVYNVSYGSKYVYMRAPVVSSCIFGSFIIIVSVSLLATFGMFLLGNMNDIFYDVISLVELDMLGDLGDIGLLISVIMCWISAWDILIGIYLVMSGIWMGQLNKKMYLDNEEVDKERALLTEIESKTNAAIMEERRKKKEQEEKERKAREEEERRVKQEQQEAQQKQQEKKQELMEMMILQMLRSNGANVDNMEDAVSAFAAELAAKNAFDRQSTSAQTPNPDIYTPTDEV